MKRKSTITDDSTTSDQQEDAPAPGVRLGFPCKVGIYLKGISHNLDLPEFDADTPPLEQLASNCATVPNGKIILSDILQNLDSATHC